MDVQLICNEGVVTYNKFLRINPMGPIFPYDDSLNIIALHPVKNARGEPNGP